jgi:hypothetical protein
MARNKLIFPTHDNNCDRDSKQATAGTRITMFRHIRAWHHRHHCHHQQLV